MEDSAPPLRQVGSSIGYAWIQEQLGLPNFLLTPAARLGNVAAIQRLPEGAMLVPARMAVEPSMLAHTLFALKHEGVNLHLLGAALRRIGAAELIFEAHTTPNGLYVRKACHLWEFFNGTKLQMPGNDFAIVAAYAPMFEPAEYVTGASRRDPRWRIDFNGLGNHEFCPVIRRTRGLQALLDADLLGQAREFAQSTSKAMLDRTLAWAYLSETEGSFSIEGEAPSTSKAEAFAKILRLADEPRQLNEDYLVDLQNSVITNPLDAAPQFRTEQNRLQGPSRGVPGVTYVPPAPELANELMHALMELANSPPGDTDTLIRAAAVSFGFVYIHPFMDGNGRLSRFLIHHCLGQSGLLPRKFLLPISVAMKREEARYLEALQSFSRPARELCNVTWLGGDEFTYDWNPEADLAFRYVDMTECAEFTLNMAKISLEEDLRRETQFLANYDQVYRAIDEKFDIRGPDLSNLIVCAFDNGGTLSKSRRKKYAGRVQEATLDAIENEVRSCLRQQEPQDIDDAESAEEDVERSRAERTG